jgi:hypothetical protein
VRDPEEVENHDDEGIRSDASSERERERESECECECECNGWRMVMPEQAGRSDSVGYWIVARLGPSRARGEVRERKGFGDSEKCGRRRVFHRTERCFPGRATACRSSVCVSPRAGAVAVALLVGCGESERQVSCCNMHYCYSLTSTRALRWLWLSNQSQINCHVTLTPI